MRLRVWVAGLAPAFFSMPVQAQSFADDVAFLRQHTSVVVLSAKKGQARVAVCPELQGRVLTSSARGDRGPSYGWINRALIASKQRTPHINAYGGEDRFWLGPEGGQFAARVGSIRDFQRAPDRAVSAVG